jgi:hypothetical protein
VGEGRRISKKGGNFVSTCVVESTAFRFDSGVREAGWEPPLKRFSLEKPGEFYRDLIFFCGTVLYLNKVLGKVV